MRDGADEVGVVVGVNSLDGLGLMVVGVVAKEYKLVAIGTNVRKDLRELLVVDAFVVDFYALESELSRDGNNTIDWLVLGLDPVVADFVVGGGVSVRGHCVPRYDGLVAEHYAPLIIHGSLNILLDFLDPHAHIINCPFIGELVVHDLLLADPRLFECLLEVVAAEVGLGVLVYEHRGPLSHSLRCVLVKHGGLFHKLKGCLSLFVAVCLL